MQTDDSTVKALCFLFLIYLYQMKKCLFFIFVIFSSPCVVLIRLSGKWSFACGAVQPSRNPT